MLRWSISLSQRWDASALHLCIRRIPPSSPTEDWGGCVAQRGHDGFLLTHDAQKHSDDHTREVLCICRCAEAVWGSTPGDVNKNIAVCMSLSILWTDMQVCRPDCDRDKGSYKEASFHLLSSCILFMQKHRPSWF